MLTIYIINFTKIICIHSSYSSKNLSNIILTYSFVVHRKSLNFGYNVVGNVFIMKVKFFYRF